MNDTKKISRKRSLGIVMICVLIGVAIAVWQQKGSARSQDDLAKPAPAEIEHDAVVPAAPAACIKIFRYSEKAGNLPAGCLPGDTYMDMLDRAAVGEEGIVLFRVKGEAGDCYIMEPWLHRPDNSGQSLGEMDPCTGSNLRWLPGANLIVMHGSQEFRVYDTTGKIVRRFTPDPAYRILESEVNPKTGHIAAFLLETATEMSGPVPLADLVVLTPEGKMIARLEKIVDVPHSDGFWLPSRLFWLDDRRIVFLRRTGSEPSGEGEYRTIAIADYAQRTVKVTDASTGAITGVSPDGRVVLAEGRLYQASSGKTTDPDLPPPVHPSDVTFSPNGRMITARAYENGVSNLGVLHLKEKAWVELGRGAVIGWSPDDTLYWAEAKQ